MSSAAFLSMHWGDWFQLFLQYLSLSLLSIGGAISTVPEMHRYLVDERHWLTEGQFNASITLAQVAPGPNVLFVALMGWQVGINTGSIVMGFLGAALTMAGIMLPSATLTYLGARWGHKNRSLRAVRAFKLGMAPIVIALIIATGWLLTAVHNDPKTDWRLWLLTAVTAIVIWRTRVHLLWMLGAGAVLGWFGFV